MHPGLNVQDSRVTVPVPRDLRTFAFDWAENSQETMLSPKTRILGPKAQHKAAKAWLMEQ